MVEALCYSPSPLPQDVTATYSPSPTYSSPRMMTREEHMLKELNLQRCGLRKAPPKRPATISNYSLAAAFLPQSAVVAGSPLSSVTLSRATPRTMPSNHHHQITDSHESDATTTKAKPISSNAAAGPEKLPRRPGMGVPRRSYSLMDYQPIPKSEEPSSGLQLSDLPTELHCAIFDYLDPLDSTCIGLTCRHFYAVHKRMHGAKVSLATRRSGPNDVEWVWRLAGQLHAHLANPTTHPEKAQQALLSLEAFRIRGATYCKKCGARRCELHRHIREWMGSDYEYCSVKGKFAAAAQPGARPQCYRRKPNDPHQCGRHRQPSTATARTLNF